MNLKEKLMKINVIKSSAMLMIAIAIVGAIGTGGLLVQHANAAAIVQKGITCDSPFGEGTGIKVFTPSGKDILSCHVIQEEP
jgi:hypothetical protein